MIELALPIGMDLSRNSFVKIMNDRFRTGTEIDAILTFYGDEPIKELSYNIDQVPFLEVYSDFDTPF